MPITERERRSTYARLHLIIQDGLMLMAEWKGTKMTVSRMGTIAALAAASATIINMKAEDGVI